MTFSNKSTQPTFPISYAEQPPAPHRSIYTQRRDVLSLKARLLNKIQCDDYWPTLTKFLRGEISKQEYDSLIQKYLYDNESRSLHNEFIRSLIFNARFSTIPPPGMKIPVSSTPRAFDVKYDSRMQKLLVADIGCMPNLQMMSLRIERKIMEKKIKMDRKVALNIYFYVFDFLLYVLKKSVQLLKVNDDNNTNPVVKTEQILTIIHSNDKLIDFISNRTFEKFLFDD